jgi:hypothetical protein
MGGDGNIQTLGDRVHRRSELRDASSNGQQMRLTVSGRHGGWTARIALICAGMYRSQEQLKAMQPRSSCIPLECLHRRQIIVIYLR